MNKALALGITATIVGVTYARQIHVIANSVKMWRRK